MNGNPPGDEQKNGYAGPPAWDGRTGARPDEPPGAARIGPAAPGAEPDPGILLQQALDALVGGDAARAATAAQRAAVAAGGPDADTQRGWASWLVGLAHLYEGDLEGTRPPLQQAQHLALQRQQPALAMAVSLAQQLAGRYDVQRQWRQYVTHLLKHLEDEDVRLTQEFRAMLQLARDSWPAMQAPVLSPLPGPGAPARPAGSSAARPPAAIPPLHVQMLGPFRVAVGNQEISLRGSSRGADLLKYLLSNRPRPTPKDTLLQTLYPDDEPGVDLKTRMHRLHLAVYQLRQILKGAGADRYVIFRDDTYLLNPAAPLDVDVDRFRDAVRQGQTLERAGRGAESIGPYETAIALYHDDFLVENLDAEWAGPPRTHLCEAYLGVLARLCEQYVQAGRYVEALEAAHRLLAKDNYREDGHCFVMRCLLALGRRNQALQEYQSYVALLQAELGIEPAAETTALYEQIKSETLA